MTEKFLELSIDNELRHVFVALDAPDDVAGLVHQCLLWLLEGLNLHLLPASQAGAGEYRGWTVTTESRQPTGE